MNNIVDFLNLPVKFKDDFCLCSDSQKTYTYNEFMEKALLLANEIMEKKLKNQPIGVMASHKADTLVEFAAVILSGNYYVSVSDETVDSVFEKIKEQIHMAYFIDELPSNIKNSNETELEKLEEISRKLDCWRNDIGKDSPLYVVFTSGSTGIPKGILKSHGNVIDFIEAYQKEFAFDKNTVLGNQAPFYFDASSKDIYTMLYTKCKMHIFDASLFMKPIELVQCLNEKKVTVIQWVPSALSILSALGTFKTIKPKYLEKVMFVGEKFAVPQLLKWMDELPDVDFVNLYGSSEMAGICAFCHLNRNDVEQNQRIPIGKPLSNSEVFLIDSDGNRIIRGEGELVVSSRALASEYINMPELTKKVFVQRKEGYCYYSGDMAFYDDDGRIIFAGRRDHQIKHMGHRIELEEIETVALNINYVKDACCIYHKNKIILFYCGDIDKAELTTELKKSLAEYMIPNKIVLTDKIPLNANGKKDRIKLQNKMERERRNGRNKRNNS